MTNIRLINKCLLTRKNSSNCCIVHILKRIFFLAITISISIKAFYLTMHSRRKAEGWSFRISASQKPSNTASALVTCNWPKRFLREIMDLECFRYHLIWRSKTAEIVRDTMSNINVLELVRFYIDRMIGDCGAGIKGIVMDKETVCDTKLSFIPWSLSLSIKGGGC